MRKSLLLASCLGVWLVNTSASAAAAAETSWIEGQHYFAIRPAQATSVPPGKVEVIEVFSYACPACNLFYPIIDKLKSALPAKAHLSYLPASWHPEEDWRTFQRAYFAAQALGLVEKTHDAVFDAIWKGGELATMDMTTNRPKALMPTIVDISKFYARIAGVSRDAYLAAAQSFSVDASMRQADAQIKAYQVEETPTVIINGKYRLTPRSAGGNDQFISLVKWLVTRESTAH